MLSHRGSRHGQHRRVEADHAAPTMPTVSGPYSSASGGEVRRMRRLPRNSGPQFRPWRLGASVRNHRSSGRQQAAVYSGSRDALLARVVDHDDGALLCGSHPRPLPPFDAAEVVRRARGRLRRKRAVPVERLREASFGRYLIRRWEEAVVELDVRSASPRELRNTDDDPLLLTTDHFAITPGAVERRLGRQRGGHEGPDLAPRQGASCLTSASRAG